MIVYTHSYDNWDAIKVNFESYQEFRNISCKSCTWYNNQDPNLNTFSFLRKFGSDHQSNNFP